MITRRQFSAAAVGATAVGLTSCGEDGGASNEDRTVPLPDGAPELSWTGEITMAAQAYTPAVEGVRLEPGSAELKAFGEIAAEFQELYPGISIKFLGAEYNTDASAMTTQAAGGQLPDVWWQQHPIVNSSFPEGVAENLFPYMQEANPFIDGNTAWMDAYSEEIFNMTMAAPQTQYCNNADYVGTAFFYNEEVFENVGANPNPETFDELLAILETISNAGLTPSALPIYQEGYSWMSRLFLANFLGVEVLEQIDAYSEGKGISAPDVAAAWHSGVIDPRENPAVLAWWPLAKEMYSYFDREVTQLPKQVPDGSPDYIQMFAAEEVAMIYGGTWVPSNVESADGAIEVGSFNFPNLEGSDPHATNYDSANSVGGPNAAWQYFVSTESSNHTLREDGKLDAVIAWMQFFSTPERNEAIVNEYGSFVPTMNGANALPEMESISALLDLSIYAIQGGWEFSSETADRLDALFQRYVLDQIEFADVENEYVEIVQTGFDAYTKLHNLSF